MAGGAGQGCAAGHAASAGTKTSGAGAEPRPEASVNAKRADAGKVEHRAKAAWGRRLEVTRSSAKAGGRAPKHVRTKEFEGKLPRRMRPRHESARGPAYAACS